MRSGINISLALVFMALGAFLSPATCADGRHHGYWRGYHHGHGHYYDDSFHIGLGFVFSPYPYGYPYYLPAPVYTAPVQMPPTRVMSGGRSYTTTLEKPAYCREYTKKILVDGQETRAYGTACLQDDGSWRIIN